MTSGWVLHYF